MKQRKEIQDLLQRFKQGEVSDTLAIDEILGVHTSEFSTLDTNRQIRTGAPETVFGLRKTSEQMIHLTRQLTKRNQTALITRISQEKGEALMAEFPNGTYSEEGQCFLLNPPKVRTEGAVGLICAGTSDLYVLEEAKQTLMANGHLPSVFVDIGVAGIHRLLSRTDEIGKSKVLIVIAGMEGALASVVGGLFRSPIIAVPTSVGYGSHLNGITPLLGMLNSCSPGVSVVNIDNGYGAAMAACRIVEQIQ